MLMLTTMSANVERSAISLCGFVWIFLHYWDGLDMIAWQRLSWWSWRGLWRAVPPDSSSMSLGNQPFSWEVFTVTVRCGCLAAAFLRGCQSPQTLTCHVRFDLHGGDYCLWAAEESVIFPRALWGNLGGTRQAGTPHLARSDQALISKNIDESSE